MTSAKLQAERKTRAITERAGRALRINEEQEFLTRFPECDVSLKFTSNRVSDGVEVESDLFSAACYGMSIRQKDDLAALIAKRMISEGMDLRSHRTNQRHGYTTLMMAATSCGRAVVEMLLPYSDVDATTTSDGLTAAEMAEKLDMYENAECIKAFKLSRSEEQSLEDFIPIPPQKPRKSIDDR